VQGLGAKLETKFGENSAETRVLWRINEAAAFLNISTGTLYHWVSEKRVPCVRFSQRCLRFNADQLKAWALSLAQNESGKK
jgi:excisionase family DNA binding protein